MLSPPPAPPPPPHRPRPRFPKPRMPGPAPSPPRVRLPSAVLLRRLGLPPDLILPRLRQATDRLRHPRLPGL